MDWVRGREPRILAFDTGPANILIDLAMRHFTRHREYFDRDGRWALRGDLCGKALQRWLRHEFFLRKPPKSTGRELFGEPFLNHALREMTKTGLSKFDLVATLTEFTAHSLVLNYRRHLPSPPDKVILSGGGSGNPVLEQRIRAQLDLWRPGIKLLTAEQAGWPAQSIEPAAFALLAFYRWNKIPANLPKTTGAARKVLLGQLGE